MVNPSELRIVWGEGRENSEGENQEMCVLIQKSLRDPDLIDLSFSPLMGMKVTRNKIKFYLYLLKLHGM